MKINTEELITDLMTKTQAHKNKALELKKLNINQLNWRKSNESWSVLECLEHLNLYGDFYIPEISKRLNSADKKKTEIFKSGLLGNYFAKSMLPKEKLNKMNTFKSMNPIHSELDITTIDRFLKQLTELENLLRKSRDYNLNKIKTAISISKFIKLKLGDTFRVVVYHNERHMVQVDRIMNVL